MIWMNEEVEDGLRAAIAGLASMGASPAVFRLVVEVASQDGIKITKSTARMLAMPQESLDAAVETAIKLRLVGYSDGLLKLLDATGDVYRPQTVANEATGSVKQWKGFWSRYPKKVGKIEAERVYVSLIKKIAKQKYQGRVQDAEHYMLGQLEKALPTLVAAAEDDRGNFCPNATTWLRNRHADY